MNAETIKSFLHSLGFDVDGAGAAKFEAAILGATEGVIALGMAVEAAALSVVGFTTKVASGLDDLSLAPQRSDEDVADIQAPGYAASQTGKSVADVRSSLEGLAQFLRSNPGGEGSLSRLNVDTHDANGQARSMEAIFSGLDQKLSTMTSFLANQYALMPGIDENTLVAMRRSLDDFNALYSQMTKAIGNNADTATVSSNRFMTSLPAFGQIAGMADDKMGSSLSDVQVGSIDHLSKQILDDFSKIEEAQAGVIKGTLWLGDSGDLFEKITKLSGAIAGAGKAFFEFLNIDISQFSGKWLFDPISESIQSTIKYVSALVDVLKKQVKDDFSGSWGLVKDAAKVLSDSPVVKGVTKVAVGLAGSVADVAHESLPEWMESKPIQPVSEKEPGLQAQPVRNPQLNTLNKAQTDLRQEAAKGRQESNASVSVANTWFERISSGVQESSKALMPLPSKEGDALQGRLRLTLANLERLYNLSLGLLRGEVVTESGGDLFPGGKAGAHGLFQLMPGTAKGPDPKGSDAFEPIKSAETAVRYLSQLLRDNGGGLSKTLASYNRGMGNVEKYGMGLLPKETREYIPRLQSNMLQGKSVSGPQIQQQNTYNIYGGNAHDIGREVEQRQISVNSRVLRRNQTGAG